MIADLLANKVVKLSIGGLGGGLIGAGAGFLVNLSIKKIAEGIAAKKAQEELLEENEAEEDEAVEDVDGEFEVEPVDFVATARRRTRAAGKQALKDYTAYSKQVEPSPAIVEIAEKYLEETEPAGPVFIDEETWQINPDETNEGWAEVSLTYWAQDGILSIDGTEQPVLLNAEEKLGENVLALKGWKDGKLYVRNEKIRTDYMIVRMDLSYAETVLGELPPAKPRPARKGTQRVKQAPAA